MSSTPTDAEIVALMRDGNNCNYNDEGEHIDFARAVHAKWGQPSGAGEVVVTKTEAGQIVAVTRQDEEGRILSVIAESTPQPTQPQAGALESAEFGRFLSDVLTAAGLVTYGKQCKQLGERLGAAVMKLRAHGIKGGQHGTE